MEQPINAHDKSPVTTLIFDLDGTLLDSSHCVVAAAQKALEEMGFQKALEKDILEQVGLPLERMMEVIAPRRSQDDHQALIIHYRAEYPSIALAHERVFPGAIEILERFRSLGHRLAVATGKSHEGAHASVKRRGIGSYFDAIHGILPGTPGKPHPALLERVLTDLAVPAEECVVIGDTTFDLKMAASARIRSCAVTWGVHDRTALKSQNPTWLVDSFDQLEALITS